MNISKRFLIGLMLSMLVAALTACSGGGGDGSGPAATNDTTWNELVWDDGVNEQTRKWAD